MLFVFHDTETYGTGDFVIVSYGNGNATQLARISHWIDEGKFRGWKYSVNRQQWSGLLTIQRHSLRGRVVTAVPKWRTAIITSPKPR